MQIHFTYIIKTCILFIGIYGKTPATQLRLKPMNNNNIIQFSILYILSKCYNIINHNDDEIQVRIVFSASSTCSSS